MALRRVISVAAITVICAFAAIPDTAAIGLCISHPDLCPLPRPLPDRVDEYFNKNTGHYFYTASAAEMAAAGPGWVKTGFYFLAWLTPARSRYQEATCESDAYPCRPVHRFYSAASNSHFFTADPAEAQSLQRPGSEWALEGIAFYLPTPDSSGQCGVPLYRLYNNRWASSDSNHRFTASSSARKILVDAGWTFEGVPFCTYGAGVLPLPSWAFELHSRGDSIQAPDACRDPAFRTHSCIGFRGPPPPGAVYAGIPCATDGGIACYSGLAMLDPFNLRIGGYWRDTVFVGYPASSREAAAAMTFVGYGPRPDLLGIHLNTFDLGVGGYSEISPYRRVSAADTNGGDARVFPWRPQYGTEYELHMHYFASIMSFAAGTGGAAYGAATMEFLDTRSGHRLQFNILSYGPDPGSGFEYVARDVKTGMALVGIPSGFPSRFARVDKPMVVDTSRRVPGRDYEGHGILHSFELVMNASQFRALLAAARATDGALSPDPADYVFERFGVINETLGEGSLALQLGNLLAFRRPVLD